MRSAQPPTANSVRDTSQSPGQISLWTDWLPSMDEVHEVAKKFAIVNCLNPDIAAVQFPNTT